MSRNELMKLFGMNEDALKYSVRPAAEAQVKTELLLEAVANAENLEPTEEQLEDYAKKTAENVGATAEDVKRYFGEEFLKNECRKDQAMNLIVDSAVAAAPAETEPAEGAATEEASEEKSE